MSRREIISDYNTASAAYHDALRKLRVAKANAMSAEQRFEKAADPFWGLVVEKMQPSK